jgi:hypothetical protein
VNEHDGLRFSLVGEECELVTFLQFKTICLAVVVHRVRFNRKRYPSFDRVRRRVARRKRFLERLIEPIVLTVFSVHGYASIPLSTIGERQSSETSWALAMCERDGHQDCSRCINRYHPIWFHRVAFSLQCACGGAKLVAPARRKGLPGLNTKRAVATASASTSYDAAAIR